MVQRLIELPGCRPFMTGKAELAEALWWGKKNPRWGQSGVLAPISLGAGLPPLGWSYRATGGPALQGEAEQAASSSCPVSVSQWPMLSVFLWEKKGLVANNFAVCVCVCACNLIHRHTSPSRYATLILLVSCSSSDQIREISHRINFEGLANKNFQNYKSFFRVTSSVET